MGYSPWGHRESDTTERLSRDKNQTNILKLSSKKKDENQEKVFKTLALIGMPFCTKTKKTTYGSFPSYGSFPAFPTPPQMHFCGFSFNNVIRASSWA